MERPTGTLLGVATGARFWFASILLGLYFLFVTVVLFWPTPVDHDAQPTLLRILFALHHHGLPRWFGYPALEFTANIGMFVPLGFLLAVLLPRNRWWVPIWACAGFSIFSELAQGAFLPHRYASLFDVIANSTGAALGALLALGLRKLFFRAP